jgi:hypothetical protein
MNLVVDLPSVLVFVCCVLLVCVCVELLKGPTHLPCLLCFALVPFCFTFFYPYYTMISSFWILKALIIEFECK